MHTTCDSESNYRTVMSLRQPYQSYDTDDDQNDTGHVDAIAVSLPSNDGHYKASWWHHHEDRD